MKLYTDVGNFQTLKVLSAAYTAGVDLDVEEVGHQEKVVPYLTSNKLPILEVTPGKFLFSANAATRFLFASVGKDTIEHEENEWLEWESCQLMPSVVPYLVGAIGHGKVDKTQEKSLHPLLAHLDKKLHGKNIIVGHEISSVDVAIFGTLYPLLVAPLAEGLVNQFTSIQHWSQYVLSLDPIQRAINFVTKNNGLSFLKQSLLAQPIPPSVHANTKKFLHVQADKIVTEKATNEESQPEKTVSPEEIASAYAAWQKGKETCPPPRARNHPILPQEGEKNILITSSLPYVNNVPHLGNIIGCVLSGDVFSRFCRLQNYNSLYICGTDEYGTATETKALEEGVTPQQICDKYNKLHAEIYQWLNIDFDYFGRTTTKQQTQIAQDIFWKLYQKDFILKDNVEQLQCEKCKRFLADRFVEGTCPLCGYEDARGDQCDACGKLINAVELKNPKCKTCKNVPVIKKSQHLFLDLPKLEPQLRKHLDQVFESGTWTTNAKMITNSWIRDGLKPRCISRDLKWGTTVPLEGYTDKVFYVWFDAPIGYISITANYTEKWEKWWKNPTQVDMYNFLGKDNVPFHSVIFPCTLLGADDNYTVVGHMIATEYLNYEDGKFSKSRGVGVFGDQAQSTGIPPDIYRFYLLYVRPESQDTSFSWDDFLLKNNSELLNNLGNFINRALSFLANSFESTIQEMMLNDEDKQLLAHINCELRAYLENMEKVKLRDSIRNILSISRLGNQYMQSSKPWVLVKGTPEEKARAGTVISLASNIACLLSVLIQPFMPQTSETIQRQLDAPKECNVIFKDFVCWLVPGHKIGKPSPLFQKIEAATMDELKKRFAGKEMSASPKDKVKVKGGIPTACPEEIDRLTQEVAKQGNEVRELKAKKAEKSVINEAVAKLLDLKSQLASAQGQNIDAAPGGKKKGEEKTQPKNFLPVVDGPSEPKSVANPEETERLTAEVTKQGNEVRELKIKKAEKAVVDAAVAVLIDLKRQLAVAQGQDPDTVAGTGKKKGKKT